eukprot:UN05737
MCMVLSQQHKIESNCNQLYIDDYLSNTYNYNYNNTNLDFLLTSNQYPSVLNNTILYNMSHSYQQQLQSQHDNELTPTTTRITTTTLDFQRDDFSFQQQHDDERDSVVTCIDYLDFWNDEYPTLLHSSHNSNKNNIKSQYSILDDELPQEYPHEYIKSNYCYH